MRTPVHPDRLFRAVGRQMRVIGDDFLRGLVYLLPDAQIRGAAPAVIRSVCPALVLGQLHKRRVPAVATHPCGLVDRYPQVIADFRARDALLPILVKSWRPGSRWILLRPCWPARKRCQ